MPQFRCSFISTYEHATDGLIEADDEEHARAIAQAAAGEASQRGAPGVHADPTFTKAFIVECKVDEITRFPTPLEGQPLEGDVA